MKAPQTGVPPGKRDMTLRVDVAFYDALAAAAKRDERPLAAQMRHYIRRGLEADAETRSES